MDFFRTLDTSLDAALNNNSMIDNKLPPKNKPK